MQQTVRSVPQPEIPEIIAATASAALGSDPQGSIKSSRTLHNSCGQMQPQQQHSRLTQNQTQVAASAKINSPSGVCGSSSSVRTDRIVVIELMRLY